MTSHFETNHSHLSQSNKLPETGLVRLSQILGDKKKGIPPIIPVSKSSWWAGVKSGRYPKPIKLGERTTCWNVLDIRQLINQANADYLGAG
jgi:prophage regulatory protein